jgi:hypothetical protein
VRLSDYYDFSTGLMRHRYASVGTAGISEFSRPGTCEKEFRPYEKDVRKILNESPWAKRIEVEGNGSTHPALESSEDTASGGEGGGESGEEEAGRSEEQERGTRRNGINFVVRWGSSRTVRQAWVRSQVLQKRISEADTAKSLPPAPDDYELLLAGPNMILSRRPTRRRSRKRATSCQRSQRKASIPVEWTSRAHPTEKESRASFFISPGEPVGRTDLCRRRDGIEIFCSGGSSRNQGRFRSAKDA